MGHPQTSPGPASLSTQAKNAGKGARAHKTTDPSRAGALVMTNKEVKISY